MPGHDPNFRAKSSAFNYAEAILVNIHKIRVTWSSSLELSPVNYVYFTHLLPQIMLCVIDQLTGLETSQWQLENQR